MDRCQNAWEGFADDLSSLLEQGKSKKPDGDVMIALVKSMKSRVETGDDFTIPAGGDFEVLTDFFEHFAQHPHNYVLQPMVAVIESLADKDCLAAEFAIAWDFLRNLVHHAKNERDMIAATVEELTCLLDLPEWELPVPSSVLESWAVLMPELEDAGVDSDTLTAMSTALDTNRAQVNLLEAAIDVYLNSAAGFEPAQQRPTTVEREMLAFMVVDAPAPWNSTLQYLLAADDAYCAVCSAEQLISWITFMSLWNLAEQQQVCPHAGYSREMNTHLLAHNLHLLKQALQEGSDSRALAFILAETFCSLNQQNPHPASIQNKLVRDGFKQLHDFNENSPQSSHGLVDVLLDTFNSIDEAHRASWVDPNDWT